MDELTHSQQRGDMMKANGNDTSFDVLIQDDVSSREALQARLDDAMGMLNTLVKEIRSLQEQLQVPAGPLPMVGPSANMGRTTTTFGQSELLGVEGLAPAPPEPLLSTEGSVPRWMRSSAVESLRADAMSVSSTMGAPMPPGITSSGPPTPPPQLFELEDQTGRDIASYHQNPFFVDTSLVNQLSEEQLDQLPYGVIQLDARGKIVSYNDTEARLAGYPKDRVLGRNFFAIAPCTRVKEFEGRFRDLAEGRSQKKMETFEFVFHFEKGAQRVLIMIFPAARRRGIFNIALVRK